MEKKLCAVCETNAPYVTIVVSHRQVPMCNKCNTTWYKIRDAAVVKAFDEFCPSSQYEERVTRREKA